MNKRRFVWNSLIHYRKRNLLLALGVAISTAVLTGAFIVGDSVKYSLNKIVDQRLGKVNVSVSAGDRFFSESLSDVMQEEEGLVSVPVLQTEASVSISGGQQRLSQVNIYGVTAVYNDVSSAERIYGNIGKDSVIISEQMATKLGVRLGDEILLRINKTSAIPLNAPFVSDADHILSLRVVVKYIALKEELAYLNLRNTQTTSDNVFFDLSWLQELMEMPGRVNLLLIGGKEMAEEDLAMIIQEKWALADLGLDLSVVPGKAVYKLTSERVFIDQVMAEKIEALEHFDGVLSYFVNSMEKEALVTPYSFVSGVDNLGLQQREMIVNEWLADDLNLREGDSLYLEYFELGPLRELSVERAGFVVKEVVAIEGVFRDSDLMPDIPGLSDAGNCRDWETGVPVELDAIRDKDEKYWSRYKGTPKGFISLETAKDLWGNRFGAYTAFRVDTNSIELEELRSMLLESILPSDLGFEIQNVRAHGKYAASNGVSFSQLFGGLSFFLILAAVILAALLFLLSLEDRRSHLKILTALGTPQKAVRKMFMQEGMLVAVLGVIVGLALSVLYTVLIFRALNGVWSDIVRTNMLTIHVRGLSLVQGALVSYLIALASLHFSLKFFLNISSGGAASRFRLGMKVYGFMSWAGLVLALAILLYQFIQGEGQQAALFFLAGGLLLISGISMAIRYLHLVSKRSFKQMKEATFVSMSLTRNINRSITVIVLFALATFTVITTGSNRKDLFSEADKPTSGTGGYSYYAESTVPVLQKLDRRDVRTDFGFESKFNAVQLRRADGDDASCLNLNKITSPGILGVEPSSLTGRFSFVTAFEGLNEDDPWSTLDADFGDLIPAIADETVIRWGLMMEVGDTLVYKNAMGEEMKLLLVGGLAPSIFQGSVLISEEQFLTHYPASSGSEVFLFDTGDFGTEDFEREMAMIMRDYGWLMTISASRLAEFNSITNTYLSIFMILGALGLLLGTIGLAIVLFRNVLERKSELALLSALGFGRKRIGRMLLQEYMRLLVWGIFIGSVAALVATLPAFFSSHTGVSFVSVAVILVVLLLNGYVWIRLVSHWSVKQYSLVEGLRDE